MKLGLTTLLAAALAVALLVPAAGAKPGNGSGHGPPAWAGAGNGGAKANGKPAWAGKGQAKKAEKAEQKQERRAAREAARGQGGDGPKHQNPAWVCKFEFEQMGAEAFAEEYGSNENKANAFGKCVSREAHERDGVTPEDQASPEPGDEESAAPDDSADADSMRMDALAALEALFEALRQLIVF